MTPAIPVNQADWQQETREAYAELKKARIAGDWLEERRATRRLDAALDRELDDRAQQRRDG